jgi:hypothetical protein
VTLSQWPFWLSEKKFKVLNIFHSAILWTIWKTRNDMWEDEQDAEKLECDSETRRPVKLEAREVELEKASSRPPRL